MNESTRDFFETLAKVLPHCWILGTLLLLFSFVVFMLTGEIIDDIHGKMLSQRGGDKAGANRSAPVAY